ncbi:MAG: MlaA family lipoprotein, partial [Planctomycetota bacterium]
MAKPADTLPLRFLSVATLALLLLSLGCSSTPTADEAAPPPEALAAGESSNGEDGATNEAGDSEESDDFGEFDEFEDEFEATEEVYDPLSGYNRAMFAFNDGFYIYVLEPVGWAYGAVMPEPVRVATNKAFRNFWTPVRFGNSLFQFKF